MSQFVRICGKGDLPGKGEVRELSVDGKTLCVANVKGECSAVGNVCPHRGGPLGQGSIEHGHVLCPWHAWAFNLKTGVCADFPGSRVEVYPLKVLGDDVLVLLESRDEMVKGPVVG